MKLNKDLILQRLRCIGTRHVYTETALNPGMRLMYKDAETNLQIAELGWSGFQLLDLKQEMLEVVNQMGIGPYILTSAGVFLIATEYTEGKLEDIDVETGQFLVSLINDLMVGYFGFREPLIISVHSPNEAEPGVIAFQFQLSKPTTHERWVEYFNLHSLEAEAAQEYAKKIGLNVTRVVRDDISANRILN